MTRAVFLDLDGTVVDPKAGITSSIGYAMERLGYAAPEPDSLEWCIGPPLQASFGTLLGTEDPAICNRAVEHYRERYRATGIFECQPYAGIVEAIERVKEAEFRVYLATSKPTVFADTILRFIGAHALFDGVFGSELDGTRAAKTELLAHCLSECAIDPGAAIMVGDREHDVIGARANGMECIGVLYGYGSKEELAAAGASAYVRCPSEIPEVCVRLAQNNTHPA